jgi:hypothetical protein
MPPILSRASFPLWLVAGVLAVAGLRTLAGCVATPQGLRLDPNAAPFVDATFAALCPLEGPVAGACPGEEAAFNAIVGGLTAPPASKPPALVPLFRVGVAPEAPLVHVGSVPAGTPGLVAMRRRGLGIVGPVGKPPPVAGDAGTEGGR